MHTVSVLEVVNQLLSLYHQIKQYKKKDRNYIEKAKEPYYQYVGRYIHHYLEIPSMRFVGLEKKLEYLLRHNYVTEVNLKVRWGYLLGNKTNPDFFLSAVIDRIELMRNRKNQVTGIRVCEVKTHRNPTNCYTSNTHRYQVRLYGLLIYTIQHLYQEIFPHKSKLNYLISQCFPPEAKITLRVNHIEQIMAQRAILLGQNTVCCKSDIVQPRFSNLKIKLQALKWSLIHH